MDIENYIIPTPLCEVFFRGISQGFHNEYTVRNVLLAVTKGEIENECTFVFNGKISKINADFKIKPPMAGFMDLSYKLAFQLNGQYIGKVYRFEGRKKVIRESDLPHFIANQADYSFVSDKAHRDGDFSYLCGENYCKCCN